MLHTIARLATGASGIVKKVVSPTSNATARIVELKHHRESWEQSAVNQGQGSWKDEFVTIVICAPLILTMVGALLASFGWTEVHNASLAILEQFDEMDLGYNELLKMVILAAIGIRMFK